MNVNRHGADWLLIRRWIDAELADARAKLEARHAMIEDTQFERGRIAALRSLLDFGEPAPTPESEEVNYG